MASTKIGARPDVEAGLPARNAQPHADPDALRYVSCELRRHYHFADSLDALHAAS
jgi:hypothetical protein